MLQFLCSVSFPKKPDLGIYIMDQGKVGDAVLDANGPCQITSGYSISIALGFVITIAYQVMPE